MKPSNHRPWVAIVCTLLVVALVKLAWTQQPAASELPLFAAEITVGPSWDASKPTQDQAHFREHSANLKRLRDSGSLVMGARYSDKGLVVLAAENEAAAKSMLDADPSIAAGTFKVTVHPLNVFYPGTLANRPKKSEPK